MRFPLESPVAPISDDVLLIPAWLLAPVNQPNGNEHGPNTLNGYGVKDGSVTKPHMPIDLGVYLDVVLEENRRITAETHWQDVRHLAFSSKTMVDYEPGDILTVFPENAPEDVAQLMDLMQWNDVADLQVTFICNEASRQSGIPSSLPFQLSPHSQGITFRELVRKHLDLNGIPRRSFFRLLAHFTDDNFQKDRLLDFTNPEYIDELFDYTTRPRRSILEVLQEFDTVDFPWQWAAAIIPQLRGRQFSIASGGSLKSMNSNATRFELLVAIVKYKTVIKKVRRGVCTRYLESLTPGTSLQVRFQKGSLRLTANDHARPVIMVGPGTGVAPMRSLIWERLRLQQQSHGAPDHNHVNVGSNVLFFGCRDQNLDYFYEDEWKHLSSQMPLQVVTAFSRNQSQKVYVQDQIRKQSKLVYQLLHDDGGIVFVCGSSGKMPLAVREALVDAFITEGAMTRNTAESYLANIEKQGRYRQETW